MIKRTRKSAAKTAALAMAFTMMTGSLALAVEPDPCDDHGEYLSREFVECPEDHHQETIAIVSADRQNANDSNSVPAKESRNGLIRMRSPGGAGAGGEEIVFAGESWDVSLNGRFTSFEEEILAADGNSNDFEIAFTTDMGDGTFGWGLNTGRYEIGDAIDFDSSHWGGFAQATMPVTDYLDLGVLGMATSYDDDINDNGYSFGGSVLASFHTTVGDVNFGVTPAAVATTTDGGDETTFLCMTDIYYPVTDNLKLWVYGIYTDAMSRGNLDGTFWNVGSDIVWQIDDTMELSVGYDTTLSSDDYDDDTVKIGFTYKF